jgi:hypothetical protein
MRKPATHQPRLLLVVRSRRTDLLPARTALVAKASVTCAHVALPREPVATTATCPLPISGRRRSRCRWTDGRADERRSRRYPDEESSEMDDQQRPIQVTSMAQGCGADILISGIFGDVPRRKSVADVRWHGGGPETVEARLAGGGAQAGASVEGRTTISSTCSQVDGL